MLGVFVVKSNLGSYLTMTSMVHKFHGPGVFLGLVIGTTVVATGVPVYFITRAYYRKKIKKIEALCADSNSCPID